VKHTTVATEINGKLTKVRDGMVISDMKRQTTCQKSGLQTFVISKTQKVDTIKFCSLKGQGYYMSEKWTTNFCSLKKWTLPSFVVSKVKDTTCQKSRLDITNFCSLKSQRYYKPHVRKADYKLL